MYTHAVKFTKHIEYKDAVPQIVNLWTKLLYLKAESLGNFLLIQEILTKKSLAD